MKKIISILALILTVSTIIVSVAAAEESLTTDEKVTAWDIWLDDEMVSKAVAIKLFSDKRAKLGALEGIASGLEQVMERDFGGVLLEHATLRYGKGIKKTFTIKNAVWSWEDFAKNMSPNDIKKLAVAIGKSTIQTYENPLLNNWQGRAMIALASAAKNDLWNYGGLIHYDAEMTKEGLMEKPNKIYAKVIAHLLAGEGRKAREILVKGISQKEVDEVSRKAEGIQKIELFGSSPNASEKTLQQACREFLESPRRWTAKPSGGAKGTFYSLPVKQKICSFKIE